MPLSVMQRNMLTETFEMLRKFGTTMVTVERYGDINKMQLSEDMAIPIYLSDMVILLSMQYNQNFYQKAVTVLLALLYLGVKNIRLGPTLPAFLSVNVAHTLTRQFGLMPIGDPSGDIAAMLN